MCPHRLDHSLGRFALEDIAPHVDTGGAFVHGAIRHGECFRLGQFLSAGDVEILPSARCEFHNGDNLIFYFDVYNARLQADRKTDLSVEMFLLQDGRRVNLNLTSYRLSQSVTEPFPRVTVARFVQLSGLAAGDYSLVVNVRDALAEQSQSAHASFTVVN